MRSERNEVPSIKCFINRDIIDGSIANSPSLNKYSYVQGNPVTQTDPFGNLFNIDWSGLGHTILDVAGFFWDGADVINAVWYALEGNMEMAVSSAIAVVVDTGAAVFKGAQKVFKASRVVEKVTTLATFTAAATITGIEAYYAFTDAKASYAAGTLTAEEVIKAVGLTAATAYLGVKTAKSAGAAADAIHNSRAAKSSLNSVAEGFTKQHNAGRTSIDSSAFAKNQGKDALVSKTSYAQCVTGLGK